MALVRNNRVGVRVELASLARVGRRGVAAETNLPLHWSTNENVLWHVPLPDGGNSTPAVWEGRVFVTQATANRRSVLCFDRRTGKLLWQSGVAWDEKGIDGR
jgi:outer membrane protein assembly factor BamB